MSVYEVRLTVVDHEPGRSRAKAHAELTTLIRDTTARTLTERLAMNGFTLDHAPDISEQVEPPRGVD